MINEFVEKIVVHERDQKGCVRTTQQVDVYFNFIGNYIPPAFSPYSEEELKEMAKLDALREKRHAAYLKARESGAYQRYMEKRKAQRTPLGKYGRMRRQYLKGYRPILWNKMVLSGTLRNHLREIDNAAYERLDRMIPKLAVEITQRFLAMGLTYEQIAQGAGITLEQVKEIAGQKTA